MELVYYENEEALSQQNGTWAPEVTTIVANYWTRDDRECEPLRDAFLTSLSALLYQCPFIPHQQVFHVFFCLPGM